ncbi:MAG: CDP-diacylglycerol--glycerol-3-phosphate 3-phosphatidyltransferase [Planctomycetota bacterium]
MPSADGPPPVDDALRATGWRARTPNALTVLRLFMTVACVGLLAGYDASAPSGVLAWGALALFVVASATDALDGYLARRWHAVSRFGRVMDPLADKVLVLGVFIVLAGPNFVDDAGRLVTGVAAWMPVVALTRELLVTSLRAAYERAGVDFSATWTGKLKMIAQVGGLALVLLLLALRPEGDAWIALSAGAAWTITFITAVSVVPYVVHARRASGALS